MTVEIAGGGGWYKAASMHISAPIPGKAHPAKSHVIPEMDIPGAVCRCQVTHNQQGDLDTYGQSVQKFVVA
jgi:hypothetical protein